MSTPPLILVTNDDGINAKGINCLLDIAKKYGDVVVVAPDKPQSGMGHAITINAILHLKEMETISNVKRISTNGTPVDCVKIAINEVLDRKPNLILSGINHGSNASINVLYSGTMSAAIEAAVTGYPSIGFSLLDYDANADFTAAQHYADIVISYVLSNGLPNGVCLNVNIPKIPLNEIQGIKICHQAKANWEEKFDKRTSPVGHTYYWLTGHFSDYPTKEGSDLSALEQGYVSIVPTQFDMTDYTSISKMENLIHHVK